MSWRDQLESAGFALLPQAIAAKDLQTALAEWTAIQQQNGDNEAILAGTNGPAYGARNLLQLWPSVMKLARQSALRAPLMEVLGRSPGVVRALYFDKPPGCSWALPWHKDYNIAVREHGVLGFFSKPTTKAGVPHVMAPFSLLSTMLTARIHFDDVTEQNGPLKVIPGSHRFYATGEQEAGEMVTIHCQAGDVLLMRPLLTHASGHALKEATSHRRIVHLECATNHELPNNYHWHQFEPLLEEV
jgi:hypothetical protein